MAVRRGVQIGVALAPTGVWGVVVGRADTPPAHVPLQLPEGAAELSDELTRAFAELARRLGVDDAREVRADVALLPPLADARLIELPPLQREEIEIVLRRDVGRYFLGGAGPRVVGVHLPGGSSSEGRATPVLAAAATLSLLEAVRQAGARAGVEVESVLSAHGSWMAATRGQADRTPEAVLAYVGGVCHILRIGADGPTSVRQVVGGAAEDVVQAVGAGPGVVLLLAPIGADAGLAAALARAGWSVAHDPAGSAEGSAAAWAHKGVLELVPPTLASERRRRTTRSALRMAAAAAALVVVAGGARLWGIHRELAAVQRTRSTIIAGQVGPLLSARDSLEMLTGRARTVEALASSAPRWTPVLVELARLLPGEAHLTALYASGDTLEMEAAGSRAGEALQILRQSPLFEDVRLQGIVERELEDGETVVERFRVRARLALVAQENGG